MKTFDTIIVDDSERARKGIRMILENDGRYHIVAEATNGLEAIELTKEWMPDLVLMDINMPRMGGLDATRVIKREFPYVTVIILSVSDDASDLFEAIRSGAQGYLIKSLEPSDWLSYLEGIVDGEAPVPRKMAEKILAEFRPIELSSDSAPLYNQLTERERQILHLVGSGSTNREIGNKLYISENTVKNHLKNIMSKLHIQNRVQLAAYSTKHRG